MKRDDIAAVVRTCSVAGLLFVIGTVGAMENETITIEQGILRAGLGIAVFAGAGYLGGLMDDE